MFIEPYEHKGYLFTIDYNSKTNEYTAKCDNMYTYDTDLEGLKNKIDIVVYQNKEFKLSVDENSLTKKNGCSLNE